MAISINVIDGLAKGLKPTGAPASNQITILEEDAKYIIDKQNFLINTTGVADANQVTAWANILSAVSTAVNTDLITYLDPTKAINVDAYVYDFPIKRTTAGGTDILQPETSEDYNIPVKLVVEVV